jgi:spermidine/putrescine transport system permease protein
MVSRGGRTWGRTILACVTVGYLAWSLFPIAYTVLLSFNRAPFGSYWGGYSFRWWSPWSRVSIFRDQEIAVVARHTLQVALVAASVALVLGTTLALGIRHVPRHVALFVYAILVLAIAFPPVAVGDALWIVFAVPLKNLPFGEFGWFGTRAQAAGLMAIEIPFVALIVSARLVSIPSQQEEMAADLGAPPIDVTRRVLLAQLWPAIGAALAVIVTLGMNEFVIMNALRSTDDTRSLSSAFFGRDPTPEIDALAGAVLIAGVMASTLVVAALRLVAFRRPHHSMFAETRPEEGAAGSGVAAKARR